jgi:HSP20 family molecular chaperone IbpA
MFPILIGDVGRRGYGERPVQRWRGDWGPGGDLMDVVPRVLGQLMDVDEEGFGGMVSRKGDVTAHEDEKKLQLSLDTRGFKPDEIKVKVANGVLSVCGTHEEREEDEQAGMSHRVSRSFTRSWTLPGNVEQTQVSSQMTPEGRLTILAPKKQAQKAIKNMHHIPVEHVDASVNGK